MALIGTKAALVTALLATGVALLLAPAHAQNQAASDGIPCRVSWEDTTHGGDWSTSQGEAELTQIAPQGDGSFVAIGNGHATITYHSANGCHMVGSPWSAPYMVTVLSEDGRTAQVDVSPTDEPHSVTATQCLGNADFQFDVDAPGLPTVTAPLHEGATPFSQEHAGDHGAAGDRGVVTLHYCTQH